MSVSFGGLASGIDTASLITGLVNAEKAQETVYTTQKSNLDGQKSVVANLTSALASLGTLATGMKNASELQPRKVSTSDAHVSVAVSASAAATNHTVRVVQTARAQVLSSRTFTTDVAGVLGSGSATIGGKVVTWTGSDSLADIASRINDTGAGVSASVLFDGAAYRLMVASTSTGTAGAPAMTESGDALGLTDPANVKIPARDCKVNIDGVEVTRSKNVIDDAITGVTITAVSAHAAADDDAQVAVTVDTDAVKAKLAAFAKSYNAIASTFSSQLSYTGDGKTQKSPATLFGDSTLRQLQGRVATMMSQAYGGKTLGEIGLMRDKDGFVAVDNTKVDAALAKDSNAVTSVFSSGGFAASLAAMSDDYARSGDGILAVKTKSLTSQSTMVQKQIDQIDLNAENLRSRLETQFAALETAMSKLSSQSTYLSKLLT